MYVCVHIVDTYIYTNTIHVQNYAYACNNTTNMSSNNNNNHNHVIMIVTIANSLFITRDAFFECRSAKFGKAPLANYYMIWQAHIYMSARGIYNILKIAYYYYLL